MQLQQGIALPPNLANLPPPHSRNNLVIPFLPGIQLSSGLRGISMPTPQIPDRNMINPLYPVSLFRFYYYLIFNRSEMRMSHEDTNNHTHNNSNLQNMPNFSNNSQPNLQNNMNNLQNNMNSLQNSLQLQLQSNLSSSMPSPISNMPNLNGMSPLSNLPNNMTNLTNTLPTNAMLSQNLSSLSNSSQIR